MFYLSSITYAVFICAASEPAFMCMCAGGYRGQKSKFRDLPELDLQALVSCLAWVLKTTGILRKSLEHPKPQCWPVNAWFLGLFLNDWKQRERVVSEVLIKTLILPRRARSSCHSLFLEVLHLIMVLCKHIHFREDTGIQAQNELWHRSSCTYSFPLKSVCPGQEAK